MTRADDRLMREHTWPPPLRGDTGRGPLAREWSRATSHQRLRIRSQLIVLDLPTDRFTRLHRDAWTRADIALPPPGANVDDALYNLTNAQASALIDVLRAELEALS